MGRKEKAKKHFTFIEAKSESKKITSLESVMKE